MGFNGTISNWFPIQILEIEAPQFISVGENVYKKIDWVSFSDPEKYDANAETTYCSNNVFLPEVDGIHEFGNLIVASAEHLAKTQGIDTKIYKPIITNMWMNNMRLGSKHAKHAHGGSIFAGTYYVDCPEGSGKIRIHNPNWDLWSLTQAPVTQDDNPISSAWVDFSPNNGQLLLWNAWLFHEVLENKNINPRISISFNINMVKV
jgi:uncharacterized protein (TIGR02466 family)